MPGVPRILAQDLALRAQAGTGEALKGRAEAAQRSAHGGAGKAGKAEKLGREDQLKKVAREFESIFLAQLMQKMRSAGPKSGFLDSRRENEIFTSMQDEELAKGMAQAGGIGLSKELFEQLNKNI